MNKDSAKIDPTTAGSEHPENDGESFGAWLRRQRLVRGIELPEIADSSKISLQYLKAFESDRFDLLPAEIFAKGFLRQYASYVGLDPEEVVNFYLTASQAEPADDAEEPKPRRASGGSSLGFVVILVVVIGFLVGLVWWLSKAERESGLASPEISEPGNGAVTSPIQGATDPATHQADQTPQGSLPGAAADAPAISTQGASVAGAATSPVTPAESAAGNGATATENLQVVVEFSDNCWVEARVDGERRVAITKVQGESLLLQAETSVDFVFGNVYAVRLEVNGQPYPLAPRRGTSRLAVRIDDDFLNSSEPGAATVEGNRSDGGDQGGTP